MKRPISPAMHGLIDYGFGLVNTVAPTLLDLPPSTRALPHVVAAMQGTLNAFTDQRYAVKRVIPFQTHHLAETIGVPALLAATIVTGAWKTPRARMFFGGLFAALGTVYALTDWGAKPK